MSENLEYRTNQDQDLPIRNIVLQLARIRQVFWRSYESSINCQPGQDYLAWKADENNLTFCISDGVGSSFAGQIAAKFFADKLVDWLFRVNLQKIPVSTQFRTALEKQLNQWTLESQAEVAHFEIPGNLAEMFREALQELKTVYGSQTVFLCGKIESYSECGSRVLLAGAGDMYAYALDHLGQTINLGFVRDNANRISTVSGVEGQVQVWISDPDQPVSRLVLFSDGLASLGEQVMAYNDEQLMKAVEASVLEASSDDISFLDIQIVSQETSFEELDEIDPRKLSLPEQEITYDDQPVGLFDHIPGLNTASLSLDEKNSANLFSFESEVLLTGFSTTEIEGLPVTKDATRKSSPEPAPSPDTINFESLSGESQAPSNGSVIDPQGNEVGKMAVKSGTDDLFDRSAYKALPEIFHTINEPSSLQTLWRDFEKLGGVLGSVESDSAQRSPVLNDFSQQYSLGSDDFMSETQPQQILSNTAALAKEEIPPVSSPMMVEDTSPGSAVMPETSGIESHPTIGDQTGADVQWQEEPLKDVVSAKGKKTDIISGIMALYHQSKAQIDVMQLYEVDSFIADVNSVIRVYMSKMNHSKLALQTFVEYFDSSNQRQVFKNDDTEIRALNLQSKNTYCLTLEYINGQQWNINIEYVQRKNTFHLTFQKLSQK